MKSIGKVNKSVIHTSQKNIFLSDFLAIDDIF